LTVTVSDSVFDNAGFTANGGMIYSFWDNTTVNLDTVEFKNTVGGYAVDLSGTGSVVTATGCFFNGHVAVYRIADVTTLDSDYNRFLAAFYTFDIDTVAYASVALYQAGTGQDAHSTVG
jgi:hypothetical protein